MAGPRTVILSGLVPVTTHSLPKQTFKERQQQLLPLQTEAGKGEDVTSLLSGVANRRVEDRKNPQLDTR